LYQDLTILITSTSLQADLPSTIAKNDFSLFAKVVECAGMKGALARSDAAVTVLAPTDAAIKAFLSDIGVDGSTVLRRPALCRALVAYHVIPVKVGDHR
jgi:hypothetical protein